MPVAEFCNNRYGVQTSIFRECERNHLQRKASVAVSEVANGCCWKKQANLENLKERLPQDCLKATMIYNTKIRIHDECQ